MTKKVITVPVVNPPSPGIAYQSIQDINAMMPINTASNGFLRPPRSSAAPRKGAVSAPTRPAHFATDAIAA